MRRNVLVLVLILLPALLAGCGGGDASSPLRSDPTASVPGPAATASGSGDASATLRAPPCPPAAANCERASGQIAYVQRYDPDGDGDAHFVLVSDESITAPGMSVIDVRADLRPSPLPGPGDMLAASGPVYDGSYGQRQIQADRVVVGPAGG